ncbi:hypothetical protein O6H91_14G029500 [Diphasiastrum complanatum]|uniref:Uncharacterized protein n=1 Tax=Diphasiastrum complanatum TaxID=34168 RepID=A0ACC2BMN7_DIPCM|nr:hypothetical protein O6H91_14G029500 [Diphasiastrum complanatum]
MRTMTTPKVRKPKGYIACGAAAFLALIGILKLLSSDHYMKAQSLQGEPAKALLHQQFERGLPQLHPCARRTCVFFNITIDSQPAGRIVLLLYEKQVPKAAENFKLLATGEKGKSEKGTVLHYQGTIFNRVVHNILVQGGDISGGKESEDGEPESALGAALEPENLDINFEKEGLLAMANTQGNKIGSEFFITVDIVTELNNLFVILGEVVEGMDVVLKINNVTLIDTQPTVPVIIEKSGIL